jgi:hypothetical protein
MIAYMKQVYEAILTGDRLTWVGNAPNVVGPTKVILEVPTETSDRPQGTKGTDLIRVLEQIRAKSDLFQDIPDPVEWQRALRKDRPLPGREP